MTTRRTFLVAAPPPPARSPRPPIARAQTLKWRMVTSWPKRLPGPGHVGRARRRAHQRAVRRAHRHHRLRRGRVVPAFERARCGRQRRRRHRPHRLVLLAGQDAGGGLLHHRAVRADARPSTSPGSRPAAARRCGTSSTRRSASSRSWAATPASAWAAGSAARSRASPTCAGSSCARSASAARSIAGSAPRRRRRRRRKSSLSLQSGVLDAAEFVGPGTDIALGLYRVAPFYYYPGFNKPNGTGECIVALQGVERARRRAQGDRRACLRRGGQLRARRDGAAQRRGAGGADRRAQASSSSPSRTTSSPPRATSRTTCSASLPRATPSPARCTRPISTSASAPRRGRACRSRRCCGRGDRESRAARSARSRARGYPALDARS